MMSGRREDVEQAVPDQFSYFEFVGKPFEQPLLVQAIKAAMAKARIRQQTPLAKLGKLPHSQQDKRHLSLRSRLLLSASVTPAPLNANADLQALQTEMRSLRQENTQLRTEDRQPQKASRANHDLYSAAHEVIGLEDV